MKVLLINGPNLNLLGIRDRKLYGDKSYEELCKELIVKAKSLGMELEIYQSNHEGCIIDKIQENCNRVSAIIINSGALTHYSYSIRDALEICECLKIEVHISQIYKREDFRRNSVIAEVCDAQLCGFGIRGYEMAIDYIYDVLNNLI